MGTAIFMQFVDFHTHLDSYKDKSSLEKQLSSFEGIIVAASMNLPSYMETRAISDKAKALGFKAKVIPTLGVHPSCAEDEITRLNSYKDALCSSCLIGEIGMDFCWHKDVSPLSQEKVFRFFLGHCEETKKYCVIHTKDAEEKICRILEDYPSAKPIIHWYDGPEDVYTEFTHRGYMQTFGCQTARSVYLQKLLRKTPRGMILAETDNPDSEVWLGGSDSSVFLIKRIYKDIAEALEIEEKNAAKLINRNSLKVLEESRGDFDLFL